MTTRIRASLAIFAISLTALALAASASAAPADFAWSTSVSTTQAGGHPNLTMSYASSSAQALARLDVDLPQGLMHRNSMTGACSNPLYQSDSCPATSTLGTVSTQIEIARIRISVPGTIYQLSEPSGNAAATFGIVLRPPLSALGITSKIYLRDQISFTNGGGLRHSIAGALDSVTVLGISLPSRLAQLTLSFAGLSGNNPLVSNPTSCRTQQFTATGTFSDGSSRPRTSSYATTGCAAVPFAPTGEFQLDTSQPNQRTNFAILLGGGGGSGGANLHYGHVVAIGHDFEQIGDFDLKTLDAGPFCSDAQAATTPLTCPEDSKIGDVSAEIEGFGGATGKVFLTNSPGHKTVGEITLRGASARFGGSIGGDNSSTLTFTGLPQLPLTAFKFRSTRAAMWITNTCAIRVSHMVADSFSGGHVERDLSLPKPDCTPAAPTITSGPERGITINTSHVEYRFSSPDSDVTFDCKKDDAAFAKCGSPFIDDWQGEGVHNFAVRAVRGGETGPAATATFTVDTMPPTLAFDDPADADLDGDGVADQPFRDQDFSLILAASDATSGLDPQKLTCTSQNSGDPKSTVKDVPTRPHTQGHVQVGGAALSAPGPTTITCSAADFVGWVTIVKLTVIVDGSPPSIAIDEPGVHFSDGADVEIPITVTDDSLRYLQGEVRLEVTATSADGSSYSGSAKVITDRDSGRSKGFGIFDDLPQGNYRVTVRGWDPVKKEAIAETDLVVDRTAPDVALTSTGDADLDGDGLADETFRLPTFEVPFTAVDVDSGIDKQNSECGAKSIEGGTIKGEISFKDDGSGVCSLSSLPGGTTEIQLRVHNWIGTVTIVKMTVVVDTDPPSIAIDESGVHFADGPDVEIPITVTDDSLRYPGGEVTGECSRKGWDGVVKGTYRVITDRDTGRSKGFCSFTDVEQGSYKVTVRGWDPVKRESVAETDLVVDRDPPSPVYFTDSGDLDSDGDGFADNRYRPADFALEISAADSGSGVDPDASTCLLKVRNGGTVKGNITVSNGSLLRCSFTGAPAGDADIEVSIADHRGHVTVLKAAVTVDVPDPTPPVFTLVSPASGAIIQPGTPLQVSFSVVGSGPFTYRCLIDNIVVLANCPSPSSISTVGLSSGTHTLKIVAVDAVGNSYSVSRTFTIASGGGGDVCAAIYPPPPGCPGYVPPGGGGVIILP